MTHLGLCQIMCKELKIPVSLWNILHNRDQGNLIPGLFSFNLKQLTSFAANSCATSSAAFGMASFLDVIALKTFGMWPRLGIWSNMDGWATKNATIADVIVSKSSP